MSDPPVWSDDDLIRESARSVELFRKERMEEPLDDYLEHFEMYQGHFEDLLEKTVDLKDLEAKALEILTDETLLGPFRYLAGPPISKDDLRTIADAKFSKKSLQGDPEMVERVVHVIQLGLDRRRFPWVQEDREPTEAEKTAAVLASAALMATQRMGMQRRMQGASSQEGSVKQSLKTLGFTEIAAKTMRTFSDCPKPGEFCGEAELGTRRADITVGLWDKRVLPIECKVSSSEVNSIKRLKNDAAVKAVVWRDELGRRNVVPAAVLSGVYGLAHLKDAQERGLALFWAHDIQPLIDFIKATSLKAKPRK